MTEAERFWSKVDMTESCWNWTAAKTKDGYGRFGVQGHVVRAHRWAYEHLVGPIPDGYQIDHLCRNPSCVCPEHLEPVTQRTNILRGVSFSAEYSTRTHCPKGHPYDAANTYWDGGKRRRCRECIRVADRIRYYRKRGRLEEV